MQAVAGSFSSNNFWTLWSERVFQLSQAGRYVSEFAATFEQYPPRQRPASWTIGDVLEKYYKD
jgi:arylsulfatase